MLIDHTARRRAALPTPRHPRRRARHAALVCVLGGLVAITPACAPSSTARPAQAEPADPAVVERPSAERWIVRPSSEPQTHRLRIEGTLVSRVDTLERTDTLQAELRTHWTFAAPPMAADIPARIAGTISEYRVSFGAGDSLRQPPDLTLPVTYAAERVARGDQPQLTLPRAGECGPNAPALAALRELWGSPPDTLFTGREWADSANYATCRDSILIAVTSVRSYRVLGAEEREGEVLVRISRRSVTRMTGSGTQFGEPLEIEAEGAGEVLLDLAVDGGAIRSGAGESELRMEMRGRRRAQQLVQRTRLTITAP